MDVCDQPPVPGVEGAASGITGLRRFDNPNFNPAGWNAEEYFKNPGKTEPPYLIGMTCGFCHIGFNPLNPPENPELPTWANLAGTIGNQFWEEGRLFNLRMPSTDFRWHVGNRQPAGTSDTSRFATDHINNPNAINSIFNLEFRPTQIEEMADGSKVPVHHILKDGADSIGVAGRVAARVHQHRHVLGLLDYPARSGEWDARARSRSTWRTRARTAPTGAPPKRAWPMPKRF